MPIDASFPVVSGTLPSPAEPGTTTAARLPSIPDALGFGPVRPWRRDQKVDWATAKGSKLVASAVGQILGTRAASNFTQGELAWRDEFGSLLYLLRHRNNDATTRELARVYVADALARWEPRIRVTGVDIVSEDVPGLGDVALAIRVQYDITSGSRPGNNVLLTGQETEVAL